MTAATDATVPHATLVSDWTLLGHGLTCADYIQVLSRHRNVHIFKVTLIYHCECMLIRYTARSTCLPSECFYIVKTFSIIDGIYDEKAFACSHVLISHSTVVWRMENIAFSIPFNTTVSYYAHKYSPIFLLASCIQYVLEGKAITL